MRQWPSTAEEDHHFVTSEILSGAIPLKPWILGLPSGAPEVLKTFPSMGLSRRAPRRSSTSVSGSASSWLAVDSLDNAIGTEPGWRISVAIRDWLRWSAVVEKWISVARFSTTRKFQALPARRGDVPKKMHLILAACGFGSVQDPPCMRRLRQPRVAIPAGWTELKCGVDFFEPSAEAFSIVTVLSVDPGAPPQACYQNLDKSRRNVLVPTFESKRKDLGHRWMV